MSSTSGVGGIGAHAWAARHDVRVAIGEDDDLAGLEAQSARCRLCWRRSGRRSQRDRRSDDRRPAGYAAGSSPAAGEATAQGASAAISKNAAPVRRTVFNRSDRTSAAIRPRLTTGIGIEDARDERAEFRTRCQAMRTARSFSRPPKSLVICRTASRDDGAQSQQV